MSENLITGGILAGGQGSRLGGQDKGWVRFRGKPLITQVIERLSPQVNTLLINANRNQPRYTELGYPVVSDTITGYQGPLAGAHALLQACRTPWLLIAPCDAPYLPHNLAAALHQEAENHNATIAIARDNQRNQPTHALIHRALDADLEAFLRGGTRKVMAWYTQHPHCFVEFPQSAFVNINTPEDLGEQSSTTEP